LLVDVLFACAITKKKDEYNITNRFEYEESQTAHLYQVPVVCRFRWTRRRSFC